ncbi:hypothetical protein [Oceanobacillus profundus]|uniref:hypothetical protein n=1 Tax=Oceanobacillus profundus TaxID=372463 RepID=UPI003631F437
MEYIFFPRSRVLDFGFPEIIIAGTAIQGLHCEKRVIVYPIGELLLENKISTAISLQSV